MDENVPPDDDNSIIMSVPSHLNSSRVSSTSSRSLAAASPYSCKVPVCSSASSEEGANEGGGSGAGAECSSKEDEEKRAKQERRRQRVMQEIRATEATYQQHLNLIVKVSPR